MNLKKDSINYGIDIMSLAPIVLFVYNRAWHVQQTIEALQQNELASDSELIIISDGPEKEDSTDDIVCVRRYIREIGGFKSIIIREREENLGLEESIISGVTEIVNKYRKIIVMEDDLISSKYFLRFMNEALSKYENEDKVISINGYAYPVNNLPHTYFLRNADCWGWATWKRGWDLFEYDGNKLLNEIQKKRLTKVFDMHGSYPYTRMLKKQSEGKMNSWAVRWYASAFLSNRLSLYPGKSLIRHIGNDQGTHYKSKKIFNIQDTTISLKPVVVEGIPVQENSLVLKEIAKYLKRVKIYSVVNKISHLSRRFNNLFK